MTNMLGFLIRLKTVGKYAAGLTPRRMREGLTAEHLGPVMLAKLNQVHRARKKRGGLL